MRRIVPFHSFFLIFCAISTVTAHQAVLAELSLQDPPKSKALDPSLIVAVFRGASPIRGAASTEYDIIELPSAKFPLHLSALSMKSLSGVDLDLSSYNLPNRIIVADIHTVNVEDEQATGGGVLEHTNPICDLSYRLSVSNWSSDSYDLELLNGSYRGAEIANFKLHASKDRTALVKMNTGKELFFAFTPRAAAARTIGSQGWSTERSPDFQFPEPSGSLPRPLYPKALRGTGYEGAVVALVVITREGKVDPVRFILQECPHVEFARSTFERLLLEWRFSPAMEHGRPVELVTSIEADFRPSLWE